MAKKRRRKEKNQRISPSGARLIWGLLLFALACGLYLNTLGHDFVFDDLTLITQNPDIRNMNWDKLIGFPSYRPFRNLTYALNYRIGGLDPFGYHLVNLLLHALNAVLVYWLLLRLTSSGTAAGAGALVFTVHPVQSAAVAYVSGRKDLLAAFFIVLGLICYLGFRRSGKKWPAVVALVSFGLGMLSKEVAIVIPVLLLLTDLCILRGRAAPGDNTAIGPLDFLRGRALIYLVAVGLAALALYYALFLAQASRMDGYWGGSLSAHLGTCFKLFAHYLWLAVVPYPLIADYTGDVFAVSAGLTEPATILSVLLMVAYGGVAVYLYRVRPRITFGMLWFAVCLAPVLQLIPFHELAADHFLYLPMAGPALLAGLAVRYLVQERGLGVLTWGTLGLLLIGGAFMTVRRNQDWKDDRTLWEATYRMAPGSFRANINLATITHPEDWRRALEMTQRSIELKPSEALPYNNLGAIYRMRAATSYNEGDLQEAERLVHLAMKNIERSIELYPHDPFAYSNLGDAYKTLGMIERDRGEEKKARRTREKAAHYYQRTIKLAADHPHAPWAYYKLAMVYVDGADCKTALPFITKAANELTSYQSAQYWAGACHMETGDYVGGARYMEKVLALGPDLASFEHLATCYRRTGDGRRAIEALQRAVRQFPDSAEAHHNLGVLYFQDGNIESARQHWQISLQLDSEGPLADRNRQFLADLVGGA